MSPRHALSPVFGLAIALTLGLALAGCQRIPFCDSAFGATQDACLMASDASGTADTGTGDTATDSGTGDGDGDPTGDGDGDPSSPPEPTSLTLELAQIKQFRFSWPEAAGATYYEVWERIEADGEYAQVGPDTPELSLDLTMPLHLRRGSSYYVSACNDVGCTDSDPVDAPGSLVDAVGYFKAANAGASDLFGFHLALSGDGDTLVVGAPGEGSGVDGDPADDSEDSAGAVYVFVRDPATSAWTQQAFLKASNAEAGDGFGASVAVNLDGSVIAVGAPLEDSDAQSVDGNQGNAGFVNDFGAAYVFVRDPMDASWTQSGYIKAQNANANDLFGNSIALSGEGDILAVGAFEEDSNSTAINSNAGNNNAPGAGAAYVFFYDAVGGSWVQEAYLKPNNTDSNDAFGHALALSGDGNTLAVSAPEEDSASVGVDGDGINDNAADAGAVYVFARNGNLWTRQGYIKASNTDADDRFGTSVALSYNGQDLAIGAARESSAAAGVDADEADNTAAAAGAVYLFLRDSGNLLWSQRAYFKAQNPQAGDLFGHSVDLDDEGNALVVGAHYESGGATGVGEAPDNSVGDAGAVYLFTLDTIDQLWSEHAYIKASNSGISDLFGTCVSVSGDAQTIAAGAPGEASNATSIGGDASDDSANAAGAAYLY